VVAAAVVFGPAQPAAAHSELLQASPGPAQQVGGTVDFVDLVFMASVSGAVVEVSQNGTPVPGTTEVADGLIISFALDQPLTTPGRYDVSYTVTAGDQDRGTETYFFTYEPASPQAFRLGQTTEPDSGLLDRPRTIATIAVVVGLCAVAFGYLISLERRRSAAAPDDQPPDR
jgi:methionine-rich copper-binding protein CopC